MLSIEKFESIVDDNLGIFYFIILVVLITVYIFQTISFIVWSIKIALKLKRNVPIRYTTKNTFTKYRELILSILLSIISLSFIISIFPYGHADGIEGARY